MANNDTEEIIVLDYKATSTKNLEDYTISQKHYQGDIEDNWIFMLIF